MVTAAFIGPGTITTASIAGATFGYSLLWALVFSVVATMVLQEMAARLGLVTRAGLGEALRNSFHTQVGRVGVAIVVVAAIAFGNAAYEAGNMTGAAMGLEALLGVPRWAGAVFIGAVAAALLATGAYRIIERLLIAMVVVMGVVFVSTAVIVRPSLEPMLRGALVPSLPENSLTTVIALIGTTVVPYNLFLHASAVSRKWSEDVPLASSLRASRIDTACSIALGGVVTLAVLATAAVFHGQGVAIDSAAAMAEQLEPLLGAWAHTFFAAGLLAAGLTSAITAPLAAVYATAGVLGWTTDLRAPRNRAVCLVIVAVGVIFAACGSNPIGAIIFAQAANGLLLPVIAVFLLIAVNRKKLMARYANGWMANSAGLIVVAVATGLGLIKLYRVLVSGG